MAIVIHPLAAAPNALRHGLVNHTLIQFATSDTDLCYPSTFCGWFKQRALTTGLRFVSWGRAAASSAVYSLATGASGVVVIKDTRTTDGQRTSTSIPTVANKWHFVAGVWIVDDVTPANSMKIYIGDMQVPCREPTYTDIAGVGAQDVTGTLRRWVVGNGVQTPAATAPAQGINADIAFFMLVNKALSKQELQEIQYKPETYRDRANIFCYPSRNGVSTRVWNEAGVPRYHGHGNLFQAGAAAALARCEGPPLFIP
jgi:hypothetical protein